MLRVALVLPLLLASQVALADSSGVDSRPYFPPLGCGSAADPDGDGITVGEELSCHFQDANPAVMVTIEGPTQIDVGSQGFGLYTASIPVGIFERLGAGINAAIDAPNASGCDLDTFAPPAKLKTFNDETDPSPYDLISHHDDLEPPSQTLVGVWSYQFLVLNCETPGPILLRVAMNAFDSSGDEEGEVWNSTSLEVTVPEPGAALVGAVALGAIATLPRRRRS